MVRYERARARRNFHPLKKSFFPIFSKKFRDFWPASGAVYPLEASPIFPPRPVSSWPLPVFRLDCVHFVFYCISMPFDTPEEALLFDIEQALRSFKFAQRTGESMAV